MADQQKFLELMKEFDTAMLVTYRQEGGVHIRPMKVAEHEDDGTLWLMSSAETPKVEEVEGTSEIHLTFQKDPSLYLVVKAIGEVVKDAAKAEEVWNEAYRAWFPGGPQDPTLVLIRATPRSGEYWDTTGTSKARYVYEFVKAYATGSRPKLDEEVHGKVAL